MEALKGWCLMSHKNYSMFSKKIENDENVVNKNLETNTITTEESQIIGLEQNKTIGIVNGCERLNIRLKPNKESDILCVIDKSVNLCIDVNNSTEDFYKVVIPVGIEGYCMKQFITIQHINE